MLFFYHASACIPASLLNGKTRQATEVTCLEDPLISTRVESEHILITIIRRSVNNTRIAAGSEDILNDELGKTYLGRLEFFTSHVFSSFINQSKYHVYPMLTLFIIFPYFGKVNRKMMFVGKSHHQ